MLEQVCVEDDIPYSVIKMILVAINNMKSLMTFPVAAAHQISCVIILSSVKSLMPKSSDVRNQRQVYCY